MNEFIATFHIDWRLMIAQIVNFGLVFLVLYILAAKPLKKLMEDRTTEITTGLANAEEAKGALLSAGLKKKEIIHEARGEAKEILTKSEIDGKQIVKEAKDRAIIEKEEILKQAHTEALKEKKNTEEAIKIETANLVEAGVKKIISNYVEAGHGEDIIHAMIAKK
jgi:F-type H+-transporting ATPase subunit b